MSKKQEIIKKIADRLSERAGEPKPCSLCGETNWQLQDMYANIIASHDPSTMNIGGQSFPTIPLVCMNCGNTHFINLLVLGFREELKDLKFEVNAKAEAEAEAEVKAEVKDDG